MLDLAAFSLGDFVTVLELAQRFRSLPSTGARRLPALQGKLVTSLFFEPSTRTRSSFELAARRLSADVQTFSPSSSSLAKGESLLDTARTYVAMGADVLVVRHRCAGVPQALARGLDAGGGARVAVLNGGDGLHSHPSQGLLDLFTLARHFSPAAPTPDALRGKRVVIVGDVLHSRVARSNLWALSACGAEVVLCGPATLLPECFRAFVAAPPPGQPHDPVERRGGISVVRSLEEALPGADAVMTLRLQQERMDQNLLTSLESYHRRYGLSHRRLELCGQAVPVLHPGPVNRGVELSGELLDDPTVCLVDEQVRNGIPVRMALLYLLAAAETPGP
ncbi:aspartate carbamoyltransferase catalytic subunit [Synechococcus sp. CS-1325]|nr:aspartate carbamoyltransferase catalytic subunit [Synechococcus sp. CS-1325]MCT0214099.1 aspartate carbamoyltransferase catalytic subunit [Synechococcus sp. CS-1326]MCT0229888.1 aspartate carbamoyltransferase catalytic subunit [Synechococcus sp. CS-1324]MCT0233874.1 aspartate carbamoyltransferase catalytic subunit [Synechococcus sp. CS-1327]